MKSYRQELWFQVPARRGFINITGQVEDCLHESGITEGLVLVNAMHITASVFINDDEPGLHYDYEKWLERLAPHQPVSQYHHNVGEDNADAHMKRQIMGYGFSLFLSIPIYPLIFLCLVRYFFLPLPLLPPIFALKVGYEVGSKLEAGGYGSTRQE